NEEHFTGITMGIGYRAGGAARRELAGIDLEFLYRAARQQRLAVALGNRQGWPLGPPEHLVRLDRRVLEKVGNADAQRIGDAHKSAGICSAEPTLELADEARRRLYRIGQLPQRHSTTGAEFLDPRADIDRAIRVLFPQLLNPWFVQHVLPCSLNTLLS